MLEWVAYSWDLCLLDSFGFGSYFRAFSEKYSQHHFELRFKMPTVRSGSLCCHTPEIWWANLLVGFFFFWYLFITLRCQGLAYLNRQVSNLKQWSVLVYVCLCRLLTCLRGARVQQVSSVAVQLMFEEVTLDMLLVYWPLSLSSTPQGWSYRCVLWHLGFWLSCLLSRFFTDSTHIPSTKAVIFFFFKENFNCFPQET